MDRQIGTKRLTLDIHLPVLTDGDETWLDLKPVSIRASGLTPEEAEGLAEGWSQSDRYWTGVCHDIIEAL